MGSMREYREQFDDYRTHVGKEYVEVPLIFYRALTDFRNSYFISGIGLLCGHLACHILVIYLSSRESRGHTLTSGYSFRRLSSRLGRFSPA